MDISHLIALVGGLLVGIIAGLKVLAPLTKNTVDDKILDYAEKAEAIVEGIKPAK